MLDAVCFYPSWGCLGSPFYISIVSLVCSTLYLKNSNKLAIFLFFYLFVLNFSQSSKHLELSIALKFEIA